MRRNPAKTVLTLALFAVASCGSPRSATPDASTDGGATPDVAPADVPTASGVPAILFVTQVPWSGFTVVSSTFGNHRGGVDSAPRGGALMLRLPDGTLRNLTREAGFGNDGMQLDRGVAVREPCVHWDGRRALFSMVVGAPTARYQVGRTYVWQIYEVTGLGAGERAAVTRVAGQPEGFNNVSPVYGSDDRVLFVSDRPPSGAAHHYPQLDEYESAPTTTGVYAIDAGGMGVSLLEAAPSGVLSLSVDSAGRVLFTKWDHLQRDQQADAPATATEYGAFTWADETAASARTTEVRGAEVFPEARTRDDPAYDARWNLHSFNHFFPWTVRQDGSGEETLNHVGRQELGGSYTEGSVIGDANLSYYTPESTHRNRYRLAGSAGLLQFRESPVTAGLYYATYAPEFSTAASGALIRVQADPSVNADDMALEAVTHPDCFRAPDRREEAPNSTGRYRNPLPLSDGTVVASYSREVTADRNLGTTAAPRFAYDFRLVRLARDGEHWRNGEALTAGIQGSVQWWNPDTLVSWSGTFWELDAVEVRTRPRPPMTTDVLPAPETAVFAEARVDVARLRAWMRDQNLALVVGRDVTRRDRGDLQQPFNLEVPGGVRSVARAGRTYPVAHLQFFQGDPLRGYGGLASPRAGRRLLARPMHASALPTQTAAGAPPGSVPVASDGSFAAFVPAGRAMSWQLTDASATPVVRERNWVSFVPGEIRACPSCHGINRLSQTGMTEPTQGPAALRAALLSWAAQHP